MVRHDILFTELIALIDTLTSRINSLEAENQLLRDQVQTLKKNSKKSSKPPSSDIVKPRIIEKKIPGKRLKRGQSGQKRHARKSFDADQTDQTCEYEFAARRVQKLIRSITS